MSIIKSELGEKSQYTPYYRPEKLFSISRKTKREEIGILDNVPFVGYDIWNHYEVSWLNDKGKPIVAIAQIIYASNSPNIVESKSMKLYFNSLNNTKFKDIDQVKKIISQDLENCIQANVIVELFSLSKAHKISMSAKNSIKKSQKLIVENIDDIDTNITSYTVTPEFLSVENEYTKEILYSDLLKSNCLITNQPDWASVKISYEGAKINRENLLKYIVSFRNHNEFHEQCIERIFMDLSRKCQPKKLTVYGRYTRRGGIDINPVRSTHKVPLENIRGIRQ